MFSPYHRSIGEGKPAHYKAMLHAPLIGIYEKRKKKQTLVNLWRIGKLALLENDTVALWNPARQDAVW